MASLHASPGAASSIAVLGAGSLGLAYAAHLALAGHKVQVLTRARHAQAIQRGGCLRAEGPTGPIAANVMATADPSAIRDAQLVLLACKAPDTPELLASTRHLVPTVRAAFSIQNGVEKDGWLADWSAPDLVVGAVSMIGASEVGGGVVNITMPGTTYLGRQPETSAEALGVCAAALKRSSLNTEIVDDIRSVEWSKLAQAVSGMAVAALSRLYWHDVLLDEDLSRLLVDLVREVNEVAAGQGIALIDLAGLLPVATITARSVAEGQTEVQRLGQKLLDAGATHVKVSMLQSIEKGRPTEVETLLGFICREGLRLHLDLPRTETCYRLLAAVNRRLN